MLSAEGKGRDFVDFRNAGTITVTGNHRPAFITHSEESGIDRRLLMLEMNKKIAEHMADNTRFAGRGGGAEEGQAILMWFVAGGDVRGWETLTHDRIVPRGLAETPAVEANPEISAAMRNPTSNGSRIRAGASTRRGTSTRTRRSRWYRAV